MELQSGAQIAANAGA